MRRAGRVGTGTAPDAACVRGRPRGPVPPWAGTGSLPPANPQEPRRTPANPPEGANPQEPAAPPSGTYAPSTGVSGCWSSSACSPVTRYTTRFATDTAWSANRS